MKRLAIVGFLIWLAATIGLRLGGQFILPGSTASTLILFLVSLPLMVLVARAVLAGVPNKALGAIAFGGPGMLLDAFSTVGFGHVFPNMHAEAASVFGGWLLFCNVVVLVTAAVWPPFDGGLAGRAPID